MPGRTCNLEKEMGTIELNPRMLEIGCSDMHQDLAGWQGMQQHLGGYNPTRKGGWDGSNAASR